MSKLFELKKIWKLLLFIGLILIICGGIFIWLYQRYKSFTEIDAKIYKAEIVHDAYIDKNGNAIDATYDLYIRYTVDGKKYEAILRKKSGFNEGDRINIFYNPNNPLEISQDINIYIPIGLLILGIISIIIGIYLKRSLRPIKVKTKQDVMMVNGNH